MSREKYPVFYGLPEHAQTPWAPHTTALHSSPGTPEVRPQGLEALGLAKPEARDCVLCLKAFQKQDETKTKQQLAGPNTQAGV